MPDVPFHRQFGALEFSSPLPARVPTTDVSIHPSSFREKPVPDDRDYSAEPPRRPRSRDDYDASREDDWDESSARRAVPSLVRTAGIIWIVFGSLMLLNAAVNLVLAGMNGTNIGGVACGALFGIAFVFVGVQSVKGTAKDTLGNGIGSLVIGVLNAGVGALMLIGGLALSSGAVAAPPQAAGQPAMQQLGLIAVIGGAVSIFAGLGLILAGVLALMGRTDYKVYRRAGRRPDPDD
jgi:hypothetical protein